MNATRCEADDRVWLSPVCRPDPARCVPLLLQYGAEVAMQASRTAMHSHLGEDGGGGGEGGRKSGERGKWVEGNALGEEGGRASETDGRESGGS